MRWGQALSYRRLGSTFVTLRRRKSGGRHRVEGQHLRICLLWHTSFFLSSFFYSFLSLCAIGYCILLSIWVYFTFVLVCRETYDVVEGVMRIFKPLNMNKEKRCGVIEQATLNVGEGWRPEACVAFCWSLGGEGCVSVAVWRGLRQQTNTASQHGVMKRCRASRAHPARP